MPWHLSKSDPRKVYDSQHQTVCVCQTAEQAALIVRAVQAFGPQTETIRLREPNPVYGPGGIVMWATETALLDIHEPEKLPPQYGPVDDFGKQIKVPGANQAGNESLDTHEPDECCGKHLDRTLRNGVLWDKLYRRSWTCPKCGMEWRITEGAIRHWMPHPVVAVFR